jgi:hypothetical protein
MSPKRVAGIASNDKRSLARLYRRSGAIFYQLQIQSYSSFHPSEPYSFRFFSGSRFTFTSLGIPNASCFSALKQMFYHTFSRMISAFLSHGS